MRVESVRRFEENKELSGSLGFAYVPPISSSLECFGSSVSTKGAAIGSC